MVDATVAEIQVRGPLPDLGEGSWVRVSGQLAVDPAVGPVIDGAQIEPELILVQSTRRTRPGRQPPSQQGNEGSTALDTTAIS